MSEQDKMDAAQIPVLKARIAELEAALAVQKPIVTLKETTPSEAAKILEKAKDKKKK